MRIIFLYIRYGKTISLGLSLGVLSLFLPQAYPSDNDEKPSVEEAMAWAVENLGEDHERTHRISNVPQNPPSIVNLQELFIPPSAPLLPHENDDDMDSLNNSLDAMSLNSHSYWADASSAETETDSIVSMASGSTAASGPYERYEYPQSLTGNGAELIAILDAGKRQMTFHVYSLRSRKAHPRARVMYNAAIQHFGLARIDSIYGNWKMNENPSVSSNYVGFLEGIRAGKDYTTAVKENTFSGIVAVDFPQVNVVGHDGEHLSVILAKPGIDMNALVADLLDREKLSPWSPP